MSDIKLRILSSDDFDNLGDEHTRGADISGSLGFCDVINKRIYVRDMGLDELNKYTIEHELEHLFNDDRGHEDALVQGIRHKKFFKDIVAPFTLLPFLTTGNPVNLLPGGPAAVRKGENKKNDQLQAASGINLTRQPPQPSQGLSSFSVPQGQAPTASPTGAGSGIQQAAPVSSVLGGGLGSGSVAGVRPELQQRLKGFFGGRAPFSGINF